MRPLAVEATRRRGQGDAPARGRSDAQRRAPRAASASDAARAAAPMDAVAPRPARDDAGRAPRTGGDAPARGGNGGDAPARGGDNGPAAGDNGPSRRRQRTVRRRGPAQAPHPRLAPGRARARQRRRPAARGDRLAGFAPQHRRPPRTDQPASAPAASRAPAPGRVRRRGRVASVDVADGARRDRRDPDQLGVDGQGRGRVSRRPGARGHEEADGARRDEDADHDAVRRGDPGARRRARQDRRSRSLRGRDRSPSPCSTTPRRSSSSGLRW